MSVEYLELVLHELTTDREQRKRYREDPQRYLSGCALSAVEREMIHGGDVLRLYRAGVSPLLVMGFWVETMRRPIEDYVRALNASPDAGGKG